MEYRYGLLGETLRHSHSPQIYEMFGIPDYQLFSVPKNEIFSFFLSTKLKGFNVTIPYKKIAYDLCDELSYDAKRLGNVNTVSIQNGKLIGYNTDYYGFAFMVDRLNLDFNNKKVLILGTGGASQTVHIAAKDRGAEKIMHLSRNPHRKLDFDLEMDSYENIHKYTDYQIIINTTPVGMFPHANKTPISLDIFSSPEAVIDLVYNPLRTRLVLEAKALDIPVAGGLLMLVAQAKMAAEIYTGKAIDDDEICKVYNKLLNKLENVVFVGMPGSGKTTIGAEIAQKMNRQFVDIDHYIHMTTNLHPAEWIISKGESAFRRVESESLARVSAMNGIVISPGGGGILSPENRILLKQNSRVYWLKRPLAKLARENRPLSMDLEALYEARRALYEAVSDHAVENEDKTEDIADKIVDEFKKPRDPLCL